MSWRISKSALLGLLAGWILTLLLVFVWVITPKQITIKLTEEHERLLAQSELSESEFNRLMELDKEQMAKLKAQTSHAPMIGSRTAWIVAGSLVWLFVALISPSMRYEHIAYMGVLYLVVGLIWVPLLTDFPFYGAGFWVGVFVRGRYLGHGSV